jgi:hypothetical protein
MVEFGLKIAVAVIAAVVLYWVGTSFLRSFFASPPPDDTPRPLEAVDLRFECSVCGSEVTMTAAPGGEVPTAPRHCMEPMRLVTDATSE